jgi:hypothetical protein
VLLAVAVEGTPGGEGWGAGAGRARMGERRRGAKRRKFFILK